MALFINDWEMIMLNAVSFNTPLQNTFCIREKTILTKMLFLLLGVLLLAVSAQLSVPLQPVPLTFQSTAVVLIGMVFGPRYGMYIVSAYLFAGMCGLPILADFSGGPIYFSGPTAGYLIGFLPAAFLGGYLAQKGMSQHWFTSFIAACISDSVIFIFGITWLSFFAGWQNACAFGLMPFIISEPIKLIAVAISAPRFWKKQ